MSATSVAIILIRVYLALLGVLMQVREEVLWKLESDGEENKERIQDLGV